MKIAKEEKAKGDVLNIAKKMREMVEKYQAGKTAMSLEEKAEIAKELSKSEAELVGLSETQEYPQEIKTMVKELCDKCYGVSKEIITEVRIHKLSALK